MSIQFFDGPRRGPSIRFLSIPPKQCVRLLTGPEGIVRVWLHWHNGRSVPCRGEACAHCPLPAKPYGYAGVQFGKWSGENWYPQGLAILGVSESAFALVTDDWRNKILSVTRLPFVATGEMRFGLLGEVEPVELVGFDLLPRLLTLWRIREAQDLRGMTGSPREASREEPKLKVIGE